MSASYKYFYQIADQEKFIKLLTGFINSLFEIAGKDFMRNFYRITNE